MTQLSDLAIADVCRRTGWTAPLIPVAVALAVAASDGRASYRHEIMPGPAARYEGLWGLDTVEYPQPAGTDLTNPYTAARVAWELSESHQGFGWCPVWRSGAYGPYLERGTAVSSRVMVTEPQTTPLITEQLPSLLHAHRVALAPALARAGRPTNRGR
jgi:hypothetical protein